MPRTLLRFAAFLVEWKFPRKFAQLQPLKDGFGNALILVFMIGFFWGILKIWSGANAISKGDSEGKGGILAGIVIAAAATMMGALYAMFGMQDAVITPRF